MVDRHYCVLGQTSFEGFTRALADLGVEHVVQKGDVIVPDMPAERSLSRVFYEEHGPKLRMV